MEPNDDTNLTEKLFTRVKKVLETSEISNSSPVDEHDGSLTESFIDGALSPRWYRLLRRPTWAGLPVLVALFLTFDTVLKVFAMAPAIEATTALGYPATAVVPIGLVELACLVLFLVPRTAVLGAILLTAGLEGPRKRS